MAGKNTDDAGKFAKDALRRVRWVAFRNLPNRGKTYFGILLMPVVNNHKTD
jgi:hypothetical protein